MTSKYFMAAITTINLINFVFGLGSSELGPVGVWIKSFVFFMFVYGMVFTAFTPREIADLLKRK